MHRSVTTFLVRICSLQNTVTMPRESPITTSREDNLVTSCTTNDWIGPPFVSKLAAHYTRKHTSSISYELKVRNREHIITMAPTSPWVKSGWHQPVEFISSGALVNLPNFVVLDQTVGMQRIGALRSLTTWTKVVEYANTLCGLDG